MNEKEEEAFTSAVFTSGPRALTVHGIALPLASSLRSDLYAMAKDNPDEPITIYINSSGGDVFEAIAVADAIQATRQMMTAPIIGCATGHAESAGAYLLQQCDHRQMTEDSILMVHGVQTCFHDVDSRDLHANLYYHKHACNVFTSIFDARTGQSWREVFEDSHPCYFDAKAALLDGLIDEIVPAWKPS